MKAIAIYMSMIQAYAASLYVEYQTLDEPSKAPRSSDAGNAAPFVEPRLAGPDGQRVPGIVALAGTPRAIVFGAFG